MATLEGVDQQYAQPCAMEPTEGKPNELEFSMRSPLSNKIAIKELRGVPARAAR